MTETNLATIPVADHEYRLYKVRKNAFRLCLTLLCLLVATNVLWGILWLLEGKC